MPHSKDDDRPFAPKTKALFNQSGYETELKIGSRTLTLWCNGKADQNWITSLACAIGPMAREEIKRELLHDDARLSPFMALVTRGLSFVFEQALRLSGADRLAFYAHKPLTTALYETGELDLLFDHHKAIIAQCPHQSLCLRSLSEITDQALIERLRAIGFRLLPLRLVWRVSDVRDYFKSRDAKRDLSLLHSGGLTAVRLGGHSPIDHDRLRACLSLYQALYLEKYSKHNPDYTFEWLLDCVQSDVLRIEALMDKDVQILAFIALYQTKTDLSLPMVGYDQSAPKALGLYRQIMAHGAKCALSQNLALHLSAGADDFKAHRKAQPEIEYLALYDRHRSWPSRLVIKGVQWVLTITARQLAKKIPNYRWH